METLNAETGAAPPLNDDAVEALCAAIAHRRGLGVARLSPDPVAPHLIQRALEAADWAPSHGDTEPWRFTVYTGESRRALGEAFAQAYRSDAEQGGDFKENAFQAQRERAQALPVLSKGVFRHPHMAEFVGLTPLHGRLPGFFVFGWPAVSWPAGARRPISEKVRWADDSLSKET